MVNSMIKKQETKRKERREAERRREKGKGQLRAAVPVQFYPNTTSLISSLSLSSVIHIIFIF